MNLGYLIESHSGNTYIIGGMEREKDLLNELQIATDIRFIKNT